METWQKNLYSLWIAQFVAITGMSMVVPFFPLYLRELGITERESVKLWSGLLFSAPFMVSVFMQPLWGILGDRHGRKSMILRAMFALAVTNLLMGFARSAPQLLILRFIQGGLAGFVAPSLALLGSCTPEHRIAQALGTLQASLVTGMIAGPLFGGMLAHFTGYRPIFFGTSFLCFLAGLIVIKFVREDFRKQERIKGSGLIQNLQYVFRSPDLRFTFILIILVQVSVQLVAPFLSLYVEYLKVSPAYIAMMTGFVFGITGVTNAVASPLWGRYADRVGYRKILRYALTGMTLFFLPQAFVTDAYQLLILRAGLGIFVGGVMPITNTIVRRFTANENRGGIYGIFQSGVLVGSVVGPLFGGLLAAFLGLRTIFLITTEIFFLACLWERKTSRKLH